MQARSIIILLLAEVVALSPWFLSNAILPDMLREADISTVNQALLTSTVQAGFVVGALSSAYLNLPDRLDPRRLLALSAVLLALANAGLLIVAIGGAGAIALRFATGVCMAGIYPIGMKIIVSWTIDRRGLLVGGLIGALTIGSALPFLIALIGGSDWRFSVIVTSLLAAGGGLSVLTIGLGPHYVKSTGFDPSVLRLAWQNRRIRYAYLGYLCHMWELYPMWAWISLAAALSYQAGMEASQAQQLAKLTGFLAIALGGLACVYAGWAADHIGKARVALIAMAISGTAAIASALGFAGPIWLSMILFIIWGIAVVPDSAQFSASVADAAPPDKTGSLIAFQTALGFGMTAVTVQLTPLVAFHIGWPTTLALLSIGPFLGILCMRRLIVLQEN